MEGVGGWRLDCGWGEGGIGKEFDIILSARSDDC